MLYDIEEISNILSVALLHGNHRVSANYKFNGTNLGELLVIIYGTYIKGFPPQQIKLINLLRLGPTAKLYDVN